MIKTKTTNKKRNLGIIVSLILIIIIGINYRVKAGIKDSVLEKEFSGYYVTYSQPNTMSKTTNKNVYIMNGTPVYCIELGVDIKTNIYNSTSDFSITNLSKDQIDYIKLISYYGYDYKEHKGDIKYYLAAQELIWRYLSDCNIAWTPSLNFPLDYIDIESYKNEILQLVKNHNIKPDITTNINTNVGEILTLEDSNKVLYNYYIESSGNQEVSIENNKLIIKINPNYIGTDTIKLVKRQDYEQDNLLYYYDESQKLISAGTVEENSLEIKLNIHGASIDIYKYDRDNNSNKSSGEATLENAKYEIYDNKNTLITNFITNKDGYSYVDNLTLGEYYIKEISPSQGYLINEEIIKININNYTNKVILYEDVIKSKIEILKLYGNKENNILNPEKNIMFNIYNSKGELYNSIKTDEKGYCEIDLPYGEYTITQLNTTKGYEKIDDIQITIDDNTDKVVRYNLFDKEINPYLRIVKLDGESNLPILQEGIKFKIKNLSTNQYVTYFNKYTNETLDTFETNNEGVTIVPVEMKNGKYEIEEITSPQNYKSSNYILDVTSDSEIYYDENYGYILDINIKNYPIKSTIKINKTGDKFTIDKNIYYYKQVPLENVKFNIYANNDIKTLDGIIHYYKNDIIDTVTTNKKGEIILENLYLGDYCIEEVETTEEYLLNKEPYCITLTEEGKTINLNNNLKTGNVIVLKTDNDTELPLKGALIELYNINDEVIQEFYSNEHGLIEINNLPLGSYYLQEKSAPKNYSINSTKYYFKLESNDQIININITNKKIRNSEIVNTGLDTSKIKVLIIITVISILVLTFTYLKLNSAKKHN